MNDTYAAQIAQALNRIAHELAQLNGKVDQLVVATRGIKTGVRNL